MGASNYGAADAAADLRRYEALKRSVTLWCLIATVVAAAGLALHSLLAAFSLFIGGLCGVLNMRLLMHGAERLFAHRSVAAFVISSFARLTAFAIVPLGLALVGRWWTLAIYFAGFFLPLALYLLLVRRYFERK
ncbi:MAG: hypothetical protein JOZ59_01030 [Candidatus Eremiobacteraeota bacterium]|nr:hypothetical protein [Candidatus Eremiobacteraeota bacterium]MBV9277877.1 hypothetical protein [Candidatus Eremiobacteraeota bacterium]